MLRELHRSLALALAAENAVLALTQLLRVVAVLVQNTPYHRLQPGLLTKIVRSVRPLTVHKGTYLFNSAPLFLMRWCKMLVVFTF